MDPDPCPVRHHLHPGPVEQPVRYIDVRGITDPGPVLERVDPGPYDFSGYFEPEPVAFRLPDWVDAVRECRADAVDTQPDGEHGNLDALRVAYASACRAGDRAAVADLSRRIAVHPDRSRPRGLTD